MKIAIMQPYFLPYIGYWQLINSVDKFIILDDVQFIIKGWINRNRFLVDKKEYMFTIPIKNYSMNKKINEIEIFNEINWRNKLLKTITQNYNKAKEFDNRIELITNIINCYPSKLSDYILNSMIAVCEFLNIKTTIVCSTSIYNVEHLKGEKKILKICEIENASDYINLYGGINLYQKEVFENSNINLKFIKTNSIFYEQGGDVFYPNLSILDLLMRLDKTKINDFLKQYTLH